MAMAQFLSLDVFTMGSDTYAGVRKTCLDIDKIESIAEQETFRCILGQDTVHDIFPVTHVQMCSGGNYILKHSYNEVMKAILAAREEPPVVLSFTAAHASGRAARAQTYTEFTMAVLWGDIAGIVERDDITVITGVGAEAQVIKKSCCIMMRGLNSPIIAVHPASELLPTFYKVNKV